MRPEHFFDWKGFKFAAKVLVLCVIAGTVGRYGLLYAAQSHTPATPSLVLIQETRPAPARSLSLTLSTTTSQHIINTLTINDVIPPTGKLIIADLSTQVLTLYEDGAATAKYPILAQSEPGSPYEIPAGFYTTLVKEPDHFNGREKIDLPWSVQFYANYFIHGLPYTADGSPVAALHAGDGIRLSTDDAEKVYAFADMGTGIFVFNPSKTTASSLVLDALPVPPVSASSFLVADVDTGDVFLEKNAGDIQTLASATKLMTALAANETIALDKKIVVANNALSSAKKKTAATKETFRAGDLFYPLLMESNDAVAASLAEAYGVESFVDWMNATAKALDMRSTHFSDVTGSSAENVSTPEDLFRLATYLANEKSFILDAARVPTKDLISDDGDLYHVDNTIAGEDAMLSVFSVPINGIERRVAIIVLQSNKSLNDTSALLDWFAESARQGVDMTKTACITCVLIPPYRKIQR